MRVWVLVVVFASVASIARADDTTAADQKFDAAQKLRDNGHPAEACELFREALRLNPNAIGTLLNVARCDEEQGKLASALRGFTDARDRAREQNLAPQRDAADEHIRALVGRVPHLALVFVAPPLPDTRVLVDDVPVDVPAAGDVLVDPGSVHVVVSAPGRVAFETHVAIAEREHHTQAIPALAMPIVLKNPRRLVGKVLAIAGAGAVVVGEGVAIYAKHEWDRESGMQTCSIQGGVLTCPPDTSNSANGAATLGDIATGVVVGGLVTAAVGVGLWYFSPNHAAEMVTVVPTFGADRAGLAAIGRF